MRVEDAVRIEFSDEVDPGTLAALHAHGLDATLPPEVEALFEAADVRDVTPVYTMSEEEIATDAIGFAAEFVLYLRPGARADGVLAQLRRSPLILNAEPVYLEEA